MIDLKDVYPELNNVLMDLVDYSRKQNNSIILKNKAEQEVVEQLGLSAYGDGYPKVSVNFRENRENSNTDAIELKLSRSAHDNRVVSFSLHENGSQKTFDAEQILKGLQEIRGKGIKLAMEFVTYQGKNLDLPVELDPVIKKIQQGISQKIGGDIGEVNNVSANKFSGEKIIG